MAEKRSFGRFSVLWGGWYTEVSCDHRSMVAIYW